MVVHFPEVDPVTGRLTDVVRERVATDFEDRSTPEGAAVAAVASRAALDAGLMPATRGTLPSGTDLNAWFGSDKAGAWRVDSALLDTYINLPSGVDGASLLEVVSPEPWTTLQRIYPRGGRPWFWHRVISTPDSNTWTPWYLFQAANPGLIYVRPTEPTQIPPGAEYVWFKTDGNGGLLDILTGKGA